jgi:hypothetical protein
VCGFAVQEKTSGRKLLGQGAGLGALRVPDAECDFMSALNPGIAQSCSDVTRPDDSYFHNWFFLVFALASVIHDLPSFENRMMQLP